MSDSQDFDVSVLTDDECVRALSRYVGFPKCQDCKWKLGSGITDNCPCISGRDQKAFDREYAIARALQARVGLVG